jgi:hypothetical protein
MWLSEQQADTNAQVQAVARKLMNWISYHGIVPGQHRDRLSEELEEFDYYGTTYRLSGRQKLLRQAQKSEKNENLNQAVMSLPRRFPRSRPGPTGAPQP